MLPGNVTLFDLARAARLDRHPKTEYYGHILA